MLGLALTTHLDIGQYLKQALLVYLDMHGSTYIKRELKRTGVDYDDIFRAFHIIYRAIEEHFRSVPGLAKVCRVGDALIYAFFTGANVENDLRVVIRHVLEQLRSLPGILLSAKEPTRLRDYRLEFRVGVRAGMLHTDNCRPSKVTCVTPAEIVSYDIDLVTKISNLSFWTYEQGVPQIHPAFSIECAELLDQEHEDVVIAIDEDEYNSEVCALYRSAGSEELHAQVYSVVDFSILNRQILSAVKEGSRCEKLEMAGWLAGRHEASFGALLRASIAPKLRLRLAKIPDEFLTRSLIISPKRAVVGQYFNFGRGVHFLVGQVRSDVADLYSKISARWDRITYPDDESRARLRDMGRMAVSLNLTSSDRGIAVSKLNEEWLSRLTQLSEDTCKRIIRHVTGDSGLPNWKQDVIEFLDVPHQIRTT